MSPDEQQIAVVEIEDTEPAIWIYDIARRTFQPFASGGRNPAWTPDGETIYFSMRGDADYDIYRRPADSSGPAEIVLAREHNQFVTGLSPDGRFLLFEENHPETNLDVWLLPIDGGDPEGLLTEPYTERGGVFSPDGNWIAYSANPAGGPAEVFVRPYPGPGRTQQISNNQGDQPVWSRNGTELWYGSSPGRLWIVPISLDNQFEAGVPELALPRALESPRWGTSSDATGDGRVVTSDANLGASLAAAAFAGVHVVVNWFQELRRLDAENR
jgi:Tol biopolymer transport system component